MSGDALKRYDIDSIDSIDNRDPALLAAERRAAMAS